MSFIVFSSKHGHNRAYLVLTDITGTEGMNSPPIPTPRARRTDEVNCMGWEKGEQNPAKAFVPCPIF